MRRLRVAPVLILAAALTLLSSAAALAAPKPSVSLKTASATVAVGASVTLTGTVTNPRPSAMTVAILERAGKRWKSVATTDLPADGAFTVEVTPGKAGVWDLLAQYKAGTVKVRSDVLSLDVQAVTAGWSSGACGGWGAVSLASDGTMWTWGRNDVGQLGLGTADTDPHDTPSEVTTDTAWAAVTAGRDHTLALKSDGTLWGWGGDAEGQLGIGETTVTVSAPVQVGRSSDWAAVSAGRHYSLALKKDGTLWAWGANGNGRLGVGDAQLRPTPTRVGGDSDWAAVACGSNHVMALKKDGSLWGWGYNGNGQLGLGDTVQRLVPTEVGLGRDWSAVSCGDDHTLALKKDGTLWAFGWNGAGQLGLGDTEDRTSPAQVGSGAGWAAVSGGHYFSLAVKGDGTLWTWGANDWGQLGVGDTDARDTPTEVVTASP